MRFKITGQRSGYVPQVYNTDDPGVVISVALDYIRQGYCVHATDVEGRLYPCLVPRGWSTVEAGFEVRAEDAIRGCALPGEVAAHA